MSLFGVDSLPDCEEAVDLAIEVNTGLANNSVEATIILTSGATTTLVSDGS